METNLISPWEEHSFWLEILQDHAYFLRDNLSPAEQLYVYTANQYIEAFGRLRARLAQINRNASFASNELISFSKEAWQIAAGYFQLEGLLQNLRVQNKVNVNLSPSYFNGTISENQEYLRILSYYVAGQDYLPLSLVDLFDLWLSDQLGHVILFRGIVDPVELSLINQAEMYITRFQGLIAQNNQMHLLLRFLTPGFPRQLLLARQAGETTIEMYKLIQRAVSLYINNEMLSKTTLRFLEHHFPETCYFLKKLSRYVPELTSEVVNCSLTKPSFK
ncbi:MAG: DUF2935 domain-containing protein [Bacillota bacterium]|nr:DUF2935 domain-containing protein [Bacillota bacterium]